MNPEAWNLQGYTGFIWGGCAWIVFVWAYFRLPETKGRTFHELDILFAKQVPARQFSKTDVDAFNEHDNNQLASRYSVAGQGGTGGEGHKFSVTGFLASHGKAEDTLAQRRSSVAGDAGRRPSIAPAVTEYLNQEKV
jgi:hypothetical protein